MARQTVDISINATCPTYLTHSSLKTSDRDTGLELLCAGIIKQAVDDWIWFFRYNDKQRALDPTTREAITRRELIKFFNGELIEFYLEPFPSLSAYLIRKELNIPTVDLYEFEKEEEREFWMK